MRNFLKKLFAGKEPESVIIPFDTLPQMLTEREAAAKVTLDSVSSEPVRNIRNAAAHLQLIVNTIAGAEHDPEIHPKLKSIAKNTLPQFIRSMNTSLAKELPEEPEEFYVAAVECVKGCLNSVSGPGRYLQIVFPDEMKSARTGIDAMGREMNDITASLGAYRREITRLNEARVAYTTIIDTRTYLQKAGEKNQRITQRIREVRERVAAIDQERKDLQVDPRMSDAGQKKTALNDLEKHREETARAYAAISMTASHVLRKAEKIATRQNHPAEIATLQHAMSLLSHHELPDTMELGAALAAACPITERMIGAGDIALKNKEERAIFSDASNFCTEVCTTCSMLLQEEQGCLAAREALVSHPVMVKMSSLEREQAQLRTMLEREIQVQKELEDWQQKTTERIPVLTAELRKKVGDIVGKDVQFQDDSRKSA
jgi:hypothetical protein